MQMEGIDEKNILEFTRNSCNLNNTLMPISRNNNILFLEDKLLLPYRCESFNQKAKKDDIEINNDPHQLTLMESFD